MATDYGQCLDVSVAQASVELPGTLDYSTGYSVAIAFRRPEYAVFNDDAVVLQERDVAGGNDHSRIRFRLADGQFDLFRDSATVVVDPSTWPGGATDNRWYLLGVSYFGDGTVKLFIGTEDDAPVEMTYTSNTPNGGPWLNPLGAAPLTVACGRRINSSARYFADGATWAGSMDHLAYITGGALADDTEWAAYWDAGTLPSGCVHEALLEFEAVPLVDTSGNGYTVTPYDGTPSLLSDGPEVDFGGGPEVHTTSTSGALGSFGRTTGARRAVTTSPAPLGAAAQAATRKTYRVSAPGAVGTRSGATPLGRDVKVAAFRDTLRTTAGTDDFTVSGLGGSSRHKAVLLFGNQAQVNATPVAHALGAYGFAVSASNRLVHAQRVGNALTTSTDGHYQDATHAYARLASATNATSVLVDLNSFITDGVRLDVEAAVTSALLLHGLLLSGADVRADIKRVTVNPTLNGSADVAIDWEPNLVVLAAAGDQYDGSTAHLGQANVSIGFARNNRAGTVELVSHSIAMRGDNEVRGNAGDYGYVSDSRLIVCDPTYNNTGPDWEFELAFPNATTARITTRRVGSDPQVPQVGLLLVDTGNLDVRVGIMATPTTTGAQAIDDRHLTPDLPWIPQAMLWALNRLSALNTFRAASAEAGTVGFAVATRPAGVAAGNVEYAATISSKNLASPTDTQSLSDARLFNVPDDDGGTTGDVVATLTALVDGGLVADFTRVNPSILYWPFLAIEQEAPTAYSHRTTATSGALGAHGRATTTTRRSCSSPGVTSTAGTTSPRTTRPTSSSGALGVAGASSPADTEVHTTSAVGGLGLAGRTACTRRAATSTRSVATPHGHATVRTVRRAAAFAALAVHGMVSTGDPAPPAIAIRRSAREDHHRSSRENHRRVAREGT